MESKEVIGNLATCVTIFMFLCPAPVFIRFYRDKNVPNQFNPLPYAFTFVLASLWWYYGEIVSDSHMIIVNAVGAIVEGIYCCLIFKFCSCATKKRQIISCLGFLIAVLLMVQVSDDREKSINMLGTINVIVNVATFGTPLVTVREVIRTKSCVSFPPVILQCAMTVTPTLWTIYSRIIGDTFLFIPNALGIVLGSFQLALRCVYPSHEVQYKELV